MLERPRLQDANLIHCLGDDFGLIVEKITFLPIGADLNTAVFRAETNKGAVFFVKLRQGDFNEACVAVPNFLSQQGIQQIIPCLPTRTGQLWAALPPYKVILFPYLEGQNAFERKLSDQQWVEFGRALKRFHATLIPPAISSGLSKEDFSPRWRDALKVFLERIEKETFREPAAAELAEYLKTRRNEIIDMLARVDDLARLLEARPPEFILCHGDIHGWNLLVGRAGALYMVDWDTLIFAPKERDLMFIGGGLGESGYSPEEEEALFYQGYGQTPINQFALAYYRYERITEDLAVYCEQLFLSDEGGEDRRRSLVFVRSIFKPGGTLERAHQADLADKQI